MPSFAIGERGIGQVENPNKNPARMRWDVEPRSLGEELMKKGHQLRLITAKE